MTKKPNESSLSSRLPAVTSPQNWTRGEALSRLSILTPQGIIDPKAFPVVRPLPTMDGMGFFLFRWFEAVASAIASVIKAIVNIIKKVVSFIAQAVYQAIRLIGKVAAFVWESSIDILTLGPLRRWSLTRGLIAGLDYITGGLLLSARKTLMLPAKLMRGEKITRADLMDALSFVAKVAMVVVTGGSTLAVIGASSSFLKDGPLGKTALGRTLLDVASVVTGAALTGANVVSSLVDRGTSWLKSESITFVANETGLSKTVLGNTLVTATQGVVGGSTTENIVKSTAVAAAGNTEAAKLLVGAGFATVTADSGQEFNALVDYTEGVARQKAAPVFTIAELIEDPKKLERYEREIEERIAQTEKIIETTARAISDPTSIDVSSGVVNELNQAEKLAQTAIANPPVTIQEAIPSGEKYLSQGMTDIASAIKDPTAADLKLTLPELTLKEILEFAMRYLLPGKNFKDLSKDEQDRIMRDLHAAYPNYTIPNFSFEFDLEQARLRKKAQGQMLMVGAAAAAAFVIMKD